MNRSGIGYIYLYTSKPHMRGDEPEGLDELVILENVNPTCVGMNRSSRSSSGKMPGKPHMRGDEPLVDRAVAAVCG